MQKVTLFFAVLMCSGFTLHTPSMTDAERTFLVKHLTDTQMYLHDAIKGLTEEQMAFKASPDRWSIRECIEHIANTEILISEKNTVLMKEPANPEKRNDVKVTDEQLVASLLDRTAKRTAPEVLKPTDKYETAEDALKAYDDQRGKTIDYCKTTADDLRGHLSTHRVFGMLDSYQWFLLVAAHQKRHTLQIEEVKADAGFPKK